MNCWKKHISSNSRHSPRICKGRKISRIATMKEENLHRGASKGLPGGHGVTRSFVRTRYRAHADVGANYSTF